MSKICPTYTRRFIWYYHRMKRVLGLFGTTPRYGMSSTEEEEDEGDAFTAYLDA